MRRPLAWFERLVFWSVSLCFVAYGALWLVLPRWVARQLADHSNGQLRVGSARLEFPFTLVLEELRTETGSFHAFLHAKRVALTPRRCDWRRRTVWLETVEIEQPSLRFSRTQEGAVVWPSIGLTAPAIPPLPAVGWQVVIQTVRMLDGVIIFFDQQPAESFQGTVSELSLVGGPFEWPFQSAQRSFAIQAKVGGMPPRTATVSCSGWVDLRDRGLDVSCQLDPLPLSAFEPYYEGSGPLRVRAYDATLKATVHLASRSNQLEGRMQLEIGNLSEADLSVFGRTVADIKKLAVDGEPVLRGEVQMAGPLDRPDQWALTLIPGNEIVRGLIKPLLDRRIGTIPVRVGGQTIPVGITPATPEAMSNVSAGSQEVEEALKILAPEGSAEPAAVTTE